MPLALTVAQMLAIDLGTDVLPALALGTEKPQHGVMSRPPRRRGQSVLDTRLLLRAFLWLGGIEVLLCYVGFALVFYGSGYTDLFSLPRADLLPFAQRLLTDEGRVYVLASTVFHAGVVAAQIGNLFACRSEIGGGRRTRWLDNRFLLLGLGFEALLILVINYVRPLARVFEHLPLPPVYWFGLILYAPALYGLEWMRQRPVQRRETARGTPTPGRCHMMRVIIMGCGLGEQVSRFLADEGHEVTAVTDYDPPVTLARPARNSRAKPSVGWVSTAMF
jgi:Ca2+-transporting ATPase